MRMAHVPHLPSTVSPAGGGLRFGCTFHSVLTFSCLVIRPLTPFKSKMIVLATLAAQADLVGH